MNVWKEFFDLWVTKLQNQRQAQNYSLVILKKSKVDQVPEKVLPMPRIIGHIAKQVPIGR